MSVWASNDVIRSVWKDGILYVGWSALSGANDFILMSPFSFILIIYTDKKGEEKTGSLSSVIHLIKWGK